ncbi:MarC family protein [bacterium]|nr:MarC family protein [bacterium]MBU3956228.1 MarC family protein [bacterium]
MNWDAVFKSTLMLFAIVNPVGSIPIFLQLTDFMSLKERKRTFRVGIFSSTAILFFFIIVGDRILTHFFQIQLSDLMAAGGLLLLIIAIDHLLFGSLVRGVLGGEQYNDPSHIGAVPIACPILAGPGAMMTVLVTFSEHGFAVAASSIIVVLGIAWVILHFIDKIYTFMGKIVCIVLSKILCLFIAAIGIRLLMIGISQYFK